MYGSPNLIALVVVGFVWGVSTTPVDATPRDSGRPPCNRYYPLPAGGEWIYREGTLAGTAQMRKTVVVRSVKIEGDRRTATVDQSVSTPGGSGAGRARTLVHCDHGRIGMTVSGVAQARGGDQASHGRVTAQIPGLPAASKLVPGYEWNSTSLIKTVEGEVEAVAEGKRRNRVAGRETVTVPAGTFSDALKIFTAETLTEKGQNRSARQELVEWYAEGVGLIKRETRIPQATQATTSIEVLVASNLLDRP